MKKKMLLLGVAVLIFYYTTLYLFGYSSLYKEGLNFIISKEFSRTDFNIYTQEIHCFLAEGDIVTDNIKFVDKDIFDERFDRLQIINSQQELSNSRNHYKRIIGIIKSEDNKLGFAETRIEVYSGSDLNIGYRKKYIWCFLFWIDTGKYKEQIAVG